MIVVDSSAIVALFRLEPGHRDIADALDDAEDAVLSAISQFELFAVLCGRRIGAAPSDVIEFLSKLDVRVVPVLDEHLRHAVDALLRYGKGRHPAALNMGDCFSYALARVLNAPLLFIGNDFVRTDITPALRPAPRGG